ncbi:MAG TPA: hypothetical protein VF177_23165 [Anaerolineae bacterium]
MDNRPTYQTLAQHRRAFDRIWSQMPERQKRTSSSWWFFLLFPKDGQGYGRRQLMFAIASRVGQQIRINDVWLPGINLKRQVNDGVDRFHAMAVGWYCDGRQVHEDIVKATAEATLSSEGFIQCWAGPKDEPRGLEICASPTHSLGLAARVKGEKGEAHFEAWGDLDSRSSSPHESVDIDTLLGGTHFVAWRRMHFRGEFDLPVTGRETLEGICYFQRVCLNVPTFPWKWIWVLFPDGSLFSAYVPYVGLQLWRQGYTFFRSNLLEQATLPILPAGFWDWPGASEQVLFKKARITPVLGDGPHPTFDLSASNPGGDTLQFRAVPYGHTRFYIDRPLLGGRLASHWSYNEYMVRLEGLDGQIQGKPINAATMGQGFGSLEYAWGLGL